MEILLAITMGSVAFGIAVAVAAYRDIKQRCCSDENLDAHADIQQSHVESVDEHLRETLETAKMAELRQMAHEHNIDIRGIRKKQQLLDTLKNHFL